MFAPDVRLNGFTTRDWQRVLELFRPRRADRRERDPDRPQGGIIAVHRDGKPVKLMHSQVGRLRIDEATRDWPLDAEELARRHAASWALSLEWGALDDAMEELGASIRREHDLTDQLLIVAKALQEQRRLGRVDTWPNRLAGLPIPKATTIQRTLDTVCPAGRTLMLGLFDRGELWTSVAIRRSSRGIDLIMGPAELRDHLGLLSGDMRRDHRHLARAVAERTAPLSLGCFAEVETFRALEVDPMPGAWALAVAVRDVVLHPVPAAMAVPLGLDAGRAAFIALREVAGRLDPYGVLNPAIDAIREVASGNRDLEGVLGYNPLELLRRLLARDS